MDKAFSSKDIIDFVPNTKIVMYCDIHKYKSLDQLLSPYGSVVILYMTKQNYGHWVCLFMRRDGVIEFFDSYGNCDGRRMVPDSEFHYISKSFRQQSYQNYPYLTKLLYDSNYPVEYNHYNFQDEKKGVNTCGRHCVVRLLNKNLTLNQYINEFQKSGISPDQLVLNLTR